MYSITVAGFSPTLHYTVDPMLLASENSFKCHEEVLSLQPMIPPKRFDIFLLTGGCSEGLDAFRFSLDNNRESFEKLKKSITSYFLFAVKKGGHEQKQIGDYQYVVSNSKSQRRRLID